MKTIIPIVILFIILILLIVFSVSAVIFVCKESFNMGWDISSKGFQSYLNLFNPYTVLFGATFVVLSVYLTLQTFRRNQEQSSKDTIIKLIEFHHNILSDMKLSNVQGKEVFRTFCHEFKTIFEKIDKRYKKLCKIQEVSKDKKERMICYSFDVLYAKKIDDEERIYGNLWSNYYKNLYFIFFYIHDCQELNRKEERKYTKIAKYQLSEYELLFLYFDGIRFKKDTQVELKFNELIEKYGVLSALNENNSLFDFMQNDYADKQFYKKSAFKN